MITTALLIESEVRNIIPEYLRDIFGIETETVEAQLFPVLDLLASDLVYFVEYPYIEKFYRDTYYYFYSKKHNECKRNSVRISIFKNAISEATFFTPDNEAQKNFLGFLTLRPTTYRIIGHSFISPKALKKKDFVTCLCKKTVLVNGFKLNVTGFPYMAQDNETITCSEAALLNIMDYFGTRYPEYSTLLPSQIHKILNRHSYQRQLPSQGLPTENISFVLKKIGFGTKAYSLDDTGKDIYRKKDFKELLFTYIESGIPVIATMTSGDYHHAVIAIGRKSISDDIKFKKSLKKKVCLSSEYHSFTEIFSEMLIMNDNHPPYELVNFEEPAVDINDKPYKITSFIVPLYSKIHLEAYQFRRLFFEIIEQFRVHPSTESFSFLPSDGNYIFRYYLASSKTYKNSLATSSGIPKDTKSLLIDLAMPKFVWIGEIIYGDTLHKLQTVNSIIVIDATESGLKKHLIFGTDSKHLVFYNSDGVDDSHDEISERNKFKIIDLIDVIFYTFADNLKGEHNKWQN